MEKIYDPKQIEQRRYSQWESLGIFKPSGQGAPYCIMIPPPNVTGMLHMGHAFQVSLMDCLVRYHRMRGEQVLWQVGTDHAGIATQMVVERKLEGQGIQRTDLAREQFVQKIWQWKEQSGGHITRQLRRLGASPDWSRECFTMDASLSEAVCEAFVQLYQKGLIYKGKRLVNWDPVLQTAVSDLEVISEEEAGKLWHIRYPFAEHPDEFITVATTRPETLLGDMAVAVHPSDTRYSRLVGRLLSLPLTQRTIPIIADNHVDPEFGSGCVKITPAHDFNDYEIGKRHGLHLASGNCERVATGKPEAFAPINIFNKQAQTNAHAGKDYQNLDRYDARQQVIADLLALNLLEKEQDYQLHVPRGDRSRAVIEPYLTEQWFVRTKPLAAHALEAVRNGTIQFIPAHWDKTYFAWLEQIQDWCISRQLWWGHRIPAWYSDDGKLYVAHSEQEVRHLNRLSGDIVLKQDEDVLDTWFSSALWPFSTLGWPQQTSELQTYYPTDILVTGFDIIFFWVSRMVMMGLELVGAVPFKEVYVHGLVRDAKGQKMSKSKGNILDPIDLIDGIDLETLLVKRTTDLMQPQAIESIKHATRRDYPHGIKAYGTDALRFMFMALASTGRDIKFDMQRIEGYRNFCNKLWNAARFTVMLCRSKDAKNNKTIELDAGASSDLVIDRWIQIRYNETLKKIEQHFQTCRFDLIAVALHEFVWHDFCDWYLELVKWVQNSDVHSRDTKNKNLACLISMLNNILKTLHPLIPFITEEIWQQIKPLTADCGDSIQQQSYPEAQTLEDLEAVSTMAALQACISAVRQLRSEMNISPGIQIPVLLQGWGQEDKELLSQYEELVKLLAKIKDIQWLDGEAQAPPSATTLCGQLKILIPLAGLIDTQAESARLNREIFKARQALDNLEARLSNGHFLDNAPSEVIEKQRLQAAQLQSQLEKYSKQLELLKAQ